MSLQNKKFTILPDFITGGIADFTNYNDGKRGGKAAAGNHGAQDLVGEGEISERSSAAEAVASKLAATK